MDWKVIADYPDYDVSEFGDVRRNKPDRCNQRNGLRLKPRADKDGYLIYRLTRDGVSRDVGAHRLVLMAFVGPPPFDDAQGCHNDGSRTNNHLSNLRWDSFLGNLADKIIHGTQAIGETHPFAVLTEDDVREIRRLKTTGLREKDIGAMFGVSQQQINKIASRKRWACVA